MSTLYKLDTADYPAAIEFCEENDIPLVTIKHKNWTKELQTIADECGVKTAVHTINKPKKAKTFLDQGVSCVYTDYLAPSGSLIKSILKRIMQ